MIEQYDDENGCPERVKPITARQYIANWASETWNRLPREVVYNSWRRAPFSYFVDEETLETNFQAEEDLYSEGDQGDEELSIGEEADI